ncbi:hypothetical protein M2772_000653 [Salmonella enterica subsp. enterica serovar Bovismorbificans]|nr:hypothetical protein [Salmonella enterica]EJD8897436.1 hypothetical protein [Salmonella enterica subsp. enterica serovar Bovismorbificans]
MKNKIRAMGLAALCVLGITDTTEAAGAADFNIGYGARRVEQYNLRVFYVITPSTQLNEASIGVLTITVNDLLGKGESEIYYGADVYRQSVLGSCPRAGRNQITTNCFNEKTGNAIACRGLTNSTGWTKPGSGHAIDNANHADMRDAIIAELKEKRFLRPSVDSAYDEWVRPGTHQHTVSIVQPGGSTRVERVSGDTDKDGEFCLYDVAWIR